MSKVSIRNPEDLAEAKKYVEGVKKSVNINVVNNDMFWNWSYSRAQFQNETTQNLLHTYSQKINHGFFSLFLILEIFLSVTNFLLVLVTNMLSNTLNVVIIDLIFYSVLAVLPFVGLLVSESYIRQNPKVLKHVATIAFFVLYIADLTLPIYHNNLQNFRPSYSSHLILACFVFFNVSHFVYSIVLAILVSVSHLVILALITYKDSTMFYKRLAADSIYFFCVIALGVYLRLMGEIIKRKTFWDRRACVESTKMHNYEKDQEEQLMRSILPENIIVKFQSNLYKTLENLSFNEILKDGLLNKHIETHENVTILYADIVNYTKMTSKLKPVTVLVETLNDLFGAFDDVSEELNVMRIKFLGDCYYCVAGIPPKTYSSETETNLQAKNSRKQTISPEKKPKVKGNHAEACVDLGLKMISIIRTVRRKRSIDIDMRIGIHTGNISSGIIGLAKWQYDIWSNDVYIANKMESTGAPGKVHITQQTKDQLKKDYNIAPCDFATKDELLRKNDIKSYLITPFVFQTAVIPEPPLEEQVVFLNKLHEDEELDAENDKKEVVDTNRTGNGTIKTIDENDEKNIISNYVLETVEEKSYKRRESRSNLQNKIERRLSKDPTRRRISKEQIGRRLSKDLLNDESPKTSDHSLTKRRTAFMQNQEKYKKHMEAIDQEMEQAVASMPFLKYEQWFKVKEVHPFFLVFKHKNLEFDYIKLPDPLFQFYIICAAVVLSCLIAIENITIPLWDWTTIIGYLTLAFIVLVLIPLTWTQYLYNVFYKKKDDASSIDSEEEHFSTSRVVQFLYRTSEVITNNALLRILLFLLLCGLCVTIVVLEMLKCHSSVSTDSNFTKSYILRYMLIDNSNEEGLNCILPWHMTEIWSLVIILTCIFLRIHLWLKVAVSFFITVGYSLSIWYLFKNIYEDSETYNYMMEAPVAHMINTAYLMLTLHFIDRQTEYLNRLDYKWNRDLEEERKKVNSKRIINRLLLDNILPAHVSKEYLNMDRPVDKFYYREYKSVSVMFASILQTRDESGGVVLTEKEYLTLMDAIICAFDAELAAHKQVEKIKIANWTYMAACGLVADPDAEEYACNESEVIMNLLKFAAKLFPCVEGINKDSMAPINFHLRIGISHGEVTAGVVGSKKPLYDIWGDAVNMASRMDSTGEIGKIQVTHNTANVLREESGVLCTYRGLVFVKGKSTTVPDVPTYFVTLDQNNSLIK